MSKPSPDPALTPVIAAIGEIMDRPSDLMQAKDPLALMQAALMSAQTDAGAPLIAAITSLDVINIVSWTYEDAPSQLAALLGISPERLTQRPTGGETPLKALMEAASAIASGDGGVFAITGAEAQHSAAAAKKAGHALPWPPFINRPPDYMEVLSYLDPQAAQMGLFLPSSVYPFFENALAHHFGQTPRQAMEESAALWSRYSAVAATNPYSWQKQAQSAEEIGTPSAANRIIGWPYTKAMVANPIVNQGMAFIVMSLAKAREHGLTDDRLVYVNAAASAQEPRNFMARNDFISCPSGAAVLGALSPSASALLELYSCFPAVPKLARRTLGLSQDDVNPTVTGGLSFFGAPLNAYMGHAVCAMTRAVQASKKDGLLYGLGEFFTKHVGISVSATPAPFTAKDVTPVHDHVPAMAPDYRGPAALETFSVPFDRDGNPQMGIVIARTPDGRRAFGRLGGDDPAIFVLLDEAQSPIGRQGQLIGEGAIAQFNF